MSCCQFFLYGIFVHIFRLFWFVGLKKLQSLEDLRVDWLPTDFNWLSTGFYWLSIDFYSFLLTFYRLLLIFYWLLLTFYWVDDHFYSILLAFYNSYLLELKFETITERLSYRPTWEGSRDASASIKDLVLNVWLVRLLLFSNEKPGLYWSPIWAIGQFCSFFSSFLVLTSFYRRPTWLYQSWDCISLFAFPSIRQRPPEAQRVSGWLVSNCAGDRGQ